MTDTETAVTVLSGEGLTSNATLTYASQDRTFLIFSEPEREPRRFEGADWFECLAAVRLYLERENRRVLCNGARRDVFPSGMARQMSGGRLAYRLTLGIQPRREDIVDVFAPCAAEEVATVKQQREFHEQWATSILPPQSSATAKVN